MKKNKLISILLIVSMLVSMLPASALAEPRGASNNTIASTLDLRDLTTNVDCNAASPAGSGHIHANDQPCWAWYANGATVDGKTYNGRVLVLNGLELNCSTDTIGIRVPDETTIVTVQGSINNIKAADSGNSNSYGIYAAGSLILDGKGTLNVKGGKASKGTSYGIYAINGVVINGGIVNATGATLNGSGGGNDVCTVSFDSDGGTVILSEEINKGGTLPSLPVPVKGDDVFTGWYDSGDGEDSKTPVGTDTKFTSDATLLARYETPMGNQLERKDTTYTLTDKESGLSFAITAPGKDVAAVQSALDLEVLDNSAAIILSITSLESGKFTVAADKGFTPGGAYRLTLGDGLTFDGKDEIIRSCDFTIQREEVYNIEFNENLGYIEMDELSDITQNGQETRMLNISPFNLNEDDDDKKITKDTGTFKLKAGANPLNIGDVVCLHSGDKPVVDKEGSNPDDSSFMDDNIAYVKITDVNDGVYTYVSAEPEEVLFLPDMLPVDNTADTDGVADNNSITVPENIFDFSDSKFAESGLNAATRVDKGDFIAFYSGAYGVSATSEGFGRITGVTKVGDTYIVTYVGATQKDIDDALNYYSENAVDPEKLIQNIDVEELEEGIAQQAIDSGFAEKAALYLVAMAMETEGFNGAVKGFDEDSLSLTLDDGSRIGLNKMRTMATKAKPVLTGLKVKATISTTTKNFGKGGLSCALDVSFSLAVVGKDNKGININVSSSFVEELKMAVNTSGKAIWKKAWIFPYIADYQFNANLDVYNYTYIKIDATVTSKDGMFTGVDISEQMENILKMTDGERIKSGVSELFELYTQMVKTESDWVEVFSKEISRTNMHLLLGIIHIRITTSFVVSVDMKVALGMEFEYISGDRYCFWLKIKAKDAGSSTVRLIDQKSTFDFYVMGTLGIRAGIGIDIAVGLFSVDLASVGLGAETGAYVRLYGFFFYKTSALNGVVISSNKAGALYMELGVYLDITFKAQALGGKYQYNPSLYYKEWPILTAGQRYNIYDFVQKDSLKEIKLKKGTKDFDLPSGYLDLQQLDLREGGSTVSKEGYNKPTENLEITSTNPAITVVGQRIHVNPPAGEHIVKGTVTVRYKNARLAFTSMPITRTLSIYWDDLDDYYYINFADGGITSIKAPYGAFVSGPTAPTRAGYTFGGWYTDKEFTQPYAFTTMPAENIFLYAKWIPKEVSYQVEHYLEGLKGAAPELKATETYTGLADTQVTPAVKSYDYFTAPAMQTVTLNSDGSTVVRYDYTRSSYNLTFKPNYDGAADIVSREKYGAALMPPLMVREGYTFDGWTPSSPPSTMPASNLTYTAQWTIRSFQAEFYLDGHPMAMGPQTYKYGETIYQPSYPGYEFLGWYSDPACTRPFVSNTMPAQDIKLYGRTIKLEGVNYTVRHYLQNLNDQGYTEKTSDTKVLTGTPGLNVTPPVNHYDGFDTPATQTVTVAAGGTTVVQYYYARQSFTLSFDINDDITDSSQPSPKTVKYGTIFGEAFFPAPTARGYTFTYWYEAIGNGNEAFTYGNATMPARDVTLNIKWTPKTDTVYKMEHYFENENGAYILDGAVTSLFKGTTGEPSQYGPEFFEGYITPSKDTTTRINRLGTTVIKYEYERKKYAISYEKNGGTGVTNGTLGWGKTLGVPNREYYIFEGWYKENSFVNRVTTMPEEDITVYAKWTMDPNAPDILYDVWIGGVRATSKNHSNITGSEITGTVEYDPDTKTLTLDGAEITTAYELVEGSNTKMCSIYANGDLTIVLQNANTVSGVDEGMSYGIYIKGNLAISGGGSLDVSGGKGDASYGIYSVGALTISEGNISVTSAKVTYTSLAIYGNSINISGGTVIARANKDAGTPIGLVGNTVTITGGKVTCSGRTGLSGNFSTSPINISGGEVRAEGISWFSGSGYYGKAISGKITITGGTLEAVKDNINKPLIDGSLILSEEYEAKASTDPSGADLEAYDAAKLTSYQYLKVGPKEVGFVNTNSPSVFAYYGGLLVTSLAPAANENLRKFTVMGIPTDEQDQAESYGIYTVGSSIAVDGGMVTAAGGTQAMNKAPVLIDYPNHQTTASTHNTGSGATAYNSANWSTYKYIQVEPGSGGGSGSGNTGGSSGGAAPTQAENTVTFTPAQMGMGNNEQSIQFKNGLQITAKLGDIPRAGDDNVVIQTTEIKERDTLNTFYLAYPDQQGILKGYTVTFSSESNGQTNNITQLNGEITLTFQLTEEEIRGIDPSTLVVYKQGEGGTVTTLAGTYDWENNTLSVRTDHLCNFYLMAQEGIPAQRLSGDNRYETAVAISRQGWKTAENVILASGEDFPDALVATTLAGLKDAPVLLTAKDKLSTDTLKEIQRLEAKNIYILGGAAVISIGIEDQLKANYTVQRISGASRYETALKLGELLQTEKVSTGSSGLETAKYSHTAILATGINYPDSLSIAPFAGRYGIPILFTGKDTLNEQTAKALKDWGVQNVILVGGTGVINESVENNLKELKLDVTRLSGDDRYFTSLKIVQHFEAAGAYTQAAIATGESYPDALAGAALATKEKMPLLLVRRSGVSPEIRDYLQGRQRNKLFVYGGQEAILDRVKDEISINKESIKK